MATKFYLRNKNTDQSTTITVRTRWKNQTLLYSTGKKIRTKHWDSIKQRVRKSHPSYSTLNHFLSKEEQLIEEALTQFEIEYGVSPTSKQFKRYLKEFKTSKAEKDIKKDFPEQDYFELLDNMIQSHEKRLKNMGKSTKNGSYATNLNQSKNVLKKYEECMDYSITFNSINQSFYEGFIDWCFNTKVYSVNNTGKHIKLIKAVMDEAVALGLTDNQYHRNKNFKVPKEEVFNTYLNETELDQLFELNLDNNPTYEKARDLFLIGCWTGLRISDVKRINQYKIVDDNFIKILPEKGKKVVEIPFNASLRYILKKYGNNPPRLSDQKLNDHIKPVCKKAGITQKISFEKTIKSKKVTITKAKYELISSHTARRSFATNRYEEGLNVITIMSITGHTTEKAFLTYIKTEPSTHRKKLNQHYLNQGRHLRVNNE